MREVAWAVENPDAGCQPTSTASIIDVTRVRARREAALAARAAGEAAPSGRQDLTSAAAEPRVRTPELTGVLGIWPTARRGRADASG
jgi:hypothetical protein